LGRVLDDIRGARVGAGLSQEDVGEAVGVSHSRISRLERGAIEHPPVDLLAAVCAVVGLELAIGLIPAGTLSAIGRTMRSWEDCEPCFIRRCAFRRSNLCRFRAICGRGTERSWVEAGSATSKLRRSSPTGRPSYAGSP